MSDGQAQGLARGLTAEFVNGRLNPDSDFRTHTMEWVKGYIERFKERKA